MINLNLKANNDIPRAGVFIECENEVLSLLNMAINKGGYIINTGRKCGVIHEIHEND